jgi:hypothetical protein
MKIKLAILFIFLNINSVATILSTESPDVSIGSVIKNTKRMYDKGIDHKIIADYINKQVDRRITSTNNIELFENPLNWFSLLKIRSLTTDLDSGSYEDIANVAWTNGLGNCEENSTLVYYILKKAGVKEHVRILRSERHSFTVWNIHSSGKTNKPSTWGDDAIVIDPWLGENLSKEEVETNKWFMNNDPEAKIIDYTHYSDKDADTWDSINSRYNRANNIEPENKDNFNDEDIDCFIATAVYGTPLASEIQILRTYRDTKLRKKLSGRFFIAFYERFAPISAYYIKNNEKEKKWVRKQIVEPSVEFAKKELKKH